VSARARDGGSSFLGRLLWPRRPAADTPAADTPADEPMTDEQPMGGPSPRAGAASSSILVERLDAIERGLADLARRLHSAAPDETRIPAGDDDIAGALTSLEKSVGRAGREQFKALALAQAQQEQMGAALDALRAAGERREAELAAWPARNQAAREATRLEMAQSLFPTLDGLDEAIRSGQQLLDRPAAPPPPPSFLERLISRRPESAPAPPSGEAALREAMAAWLTGLTFVRQRLFDVLAAEGVRPIDARGQPFDPHLHVAIDVIPAGEGHDGPAPGTIAAESRRGYRAGDRVLRYAEVAVVADAPQSRESRVESR